MNKRLKKKLGIININIARVLPSDVVVLKCNIILSDEDKRFTCRQMMNMFPHNKVVVLDATSDIEIKRYED